MPQWYFDTAILPASHINKHYAVVGRTARTIVARDRGIDLDEVRQYHATTHKYVLRQRDLLLKMPPALRAYVKDTTKADALASLYYGDLTAPA